MQPLLRAKRDLTLERELDRLDDFDAAVLDEIRYVQQEREEMEVLFTFLAARSERKSVLVTSNVVFSQWDRIFKDAMTTAAAIDRLVHHSVIVELVAKRSFHADAAQRRLERPRSSCRRQRPVRPHRRWLAQRSGCRAHASGMARCSAASRAGRR